MIKIRCVGCGWVGWMTSLGGHVQNQIPSGDDWHLTRCPRCRGLYARYA